MDSLPFLQDIFLGNRILDYLLFISATFLGLLFKRLISKYLSRIIFSFLGKKGDIVGREKFDDLVIRPLGFLVMLSIIYLGGNFLTIPEGWEEQMLFVKKSFSLIYVISIFWVLLRVIDYVGLILFKKAEATENKMDDQLIPFIIDLAKILSVIFAIFIILGNVFNLNITALITGLGIGGIAIAMASKESIENLLGSFTIFFDRPFTVGDIVTVGDVTGTVEKVGFRSTRIKTFDKSIVSVPNKKMIEAELDNLGLRPVRRVRFYLGLTYDTSVEQIKKIVAEIQEMIDSHEKTDQEGRVRFQEFGASSLDILIVYYVASPNWDDLIDVKEDVNYKIMEIVKKNNSDFAFPSTTVYVQNNN